MHKLLPYYERELATLRRDSAEFASRYPAIAGKLRLAGDGARDPGVEQMVQAFALLTARIAKRLDDDYPKFTESLLESMYPHYLRPFPSCSIAYIDNGHATGTQRDAVVVVPRKTILRSAAVQGVACQFRTVYEVIVSPVQISAARFEARIDAPRSVRLPQGVTSCLEISVYPSATLAADAPPLNRLRLFLDAGAALCCAVRDALFIHASTAHVSSSHDKQWREVGKLPISPVGFLEEEAIIPYSERSHPAYRLLTEYFPGQVQFHRYRPGRHRGRSAAVAAGLHASSRTAQCAGRLGPGAHPHGAFLDAPEDALHPDRQSVRAERRACQRHAPPARL
jgi:type VI secretion system protein ImpG